ncbi:ImmA/IrrE family metallo-endopeptidase [Sphingopyxis sp. KK2]|uniref:ImmA/IrrE family metallo-endopeptidase n=1 Tax=Sphingopyxis sp. KK2 TaxID=1855727 RepID=UPI00097E5CD2|nr:ImmA/IrrE family metallo-endopeptidase [Sphingopyxis sp. KK2]
MNLPFTHPERLLKSFGIRQPDEIDLEAIAWELGAKIRFRALNTCEARLVGANGKAIITVDARMPVTRRRFSIGHEIGHWCHHRGRCLVCRPEDIGGVGSRRADDPERVADEYASDLILPRYLLTPLLRDVPRLTVDALVEVAVEFKASRTATLRKIVDIDRYPVMMVCSSRSKRRYFRGSPSVPDKWFPRNEVSPESSAFDMLFGSATEQSAPRPVKATAWFDRQDAGGFMLQEQSFGLPGNEVMTVLTFTDRKMLAA